MYKHDAIVRAWLDGKPIEVLRDGDWMNYAGHGQFTKADAAEMIPNFCVDDYFRIKPKPIIKKYRLVIQYPDGSLSISTNHFHSVEEYNKQKIAIKALQIVDATVKEEEGDYEQQ